MKRCNKTLKPYSTYIAWNVTTNEKSYHERRDDARVQVRRWRFYGNIAKYLKIDVKPSVVKGVVQC